MEAALARVRVLDLSQRMAGPLASMIMGDLGAEVIKIESPQRKLEEPAMRSFWRQDPYYFTLNRNKKSIILDLKLEGGESLL